MQSKKMTIKRDALILSTISTILVLIVSVFAESHKFGQISNILPFLSHDTNRAIYAHLPKGYSCRFQNISGLLSSEILSADQGISITILDDSQIASIEERWNLIFIEAIVSRVCGIDRVWRVYSGLENTSEKWQYYSEVKFPLYLTDAPSKMSILMDPGSYNSWKRFWSKWNHKPWVHTGHIIIYSKSIHGIYKGINICRSLTIEDSNYAGIPNAADHNQ